MKSHLEDIIFVLVIIVTFSPIVVNCHHLFVVVKLRNWLEVYVLLPLPVRCCFYECLYCKFFDSLIGKRYIDFMVVCLFAVCLFVCFC